MLYSMTGFGRGVSEEGGYTISVEVKTVNHKFLDYFIRVPRTLNYLEESIKSRIKECLSRGRVEIFGSYERDNEDRAELKVDVNLARNYFEAISLISQDLDIDSGITALSLARLPDVVSLSKKEEDEELLKRVFLDALGSAIEQVLLMRSDEGLRIERDILDRLSTIESIVLRVDDLSSSIVEEYTSKLNIRVEEWRKKSSVELDPQRLAGEILFYADRSCIDEEITRMHSHLCQFRESIASGGSIGRKLDFLTQEMNREANTIGSKSSNSTIVSLIVELKGEIEKIREQVQNIE